jgi:serine-type D-Ala-D-Ala carboxypeptidase/endopeptidase
MIQKAQNLAYGILFVMLLISCESESIIDEALPLKEKIDQLVEPVVAFGSPSAIIIGVFRNGEKTVYGYGDAGLGFGAPRSNTIFEIGSITKTFTATLLSELISDGLVSLDDPINKYLPANVHPPSYKGENITIRHLVTHTSGLPRDASTFFSDITDPGRLSESTNDDIYTFLNDISVSAYPFDDYTNGNELPYLGTRYRYSNVGVGILGHILELASGKTYEELLEKRICTKFNMPDTRTFVDLTEEQKSRIPKAYSINQTEIEQPRDWGRYLGAGSLLSTTDDMLNYIEVNVNNSTSLSKSMNRCHEIIFRNEDLLNEDGKALRFPFNADGIGMIWYVTHANGDTIIEHDGRYNHYSNVKINITKKAGVVIFSNTYNESAESILKTIMDWITE